MIGMIHIVCLRAIHGVQSTRDTNTITICSVCVEFTLEWGLQMRVVSGVQYVPGVQTCKKVHHKALRYFSVVEVPLVSSSCYMS